MARTDLTERRVMPSDPFETSHERAYPRAGVRRNGDKWRVTLWESPGQPFMEHRFDCDSWPEAIVWGHQLSVWHPQQELAA